MRDSMQVGVDRIEYGMNATYSLTASSNHGPMNSSNPETFAASVPLRLGIASLRGRIKQLSFANPDHKRLAKMRREMIRMEVELRNVQQQGTLI